MSKNVIFSQDEEVVAWKKHRKHFKCRVYLRASESIAQFDKETLQFDSEKNRQLRQCANNLNKILSFLNRRQLPSMAVWLSEMSRVRELVERHGEDQHLPVNANDYRSLSPVFRHYWNWAQNLHQQMEEHNIDAFDMPDGYIVQTADPSDDRGVRFFHMSSTHVVQPYLVRRLKSCVKILDLQLMMQQLVECVPLVDESGLDVDQFGRKYAWLPSKRSVIGTVMRDGLRSPSYAKHQKSKSRAKKHDKRTQHRKELQEVFATQFSIEALFIPEILSIVR